MVYKQCHTRLVFPVKPDCGPASYSFDTKGLLITVAAVLLLLVPFLGKAFHIDDTLFLKTAAHLLDNPWNFYGFSFNWEGYPQQMWDINQNPPLASYFIAAAALVAGWSETALHAAFLLPALALAIGVYLLAGLFCRQPLIAALLTVFSPVFAISATTVMSDILMCALYVWGIYLWLLGIEHKREILLAASVICIGIGFLAKYFAATAIPLLFVYTIGKERTISRRLFYLVIPLLVMAGYEWATRTLYGQGLLAKAILYPSTYRELSWAVIPDKIITGLCFTGGCIASPIFLIPLARGKKILWTTLISALLVVLVILMAKGICNNLVLSGQQGIAWGNLLQMGFWLTVGGYVLALSCIDFNQSRDIKSLLLILWVFGTFTFSVFINWTVNGRTLLPMLPAIAIQQTRLIPWLQWGAIDMSKITVRKYSPAVFLVLFPAVILAFTTAWADASLANVQRAAVRSIFHELSGAKRTIWFQGHWGFQYYMEQEGALALDLKKTDMNPGDLLVLPLNNTNLQPPSTSCKLIKEYTFKPLPWLTTMGLPPVGAGFYADAWGPLPFRFGKIPPEEFYLLSCGD